MPSVAASSQGVTPLDLRSEALGMGKSNPDITQSFDCPWEVCAFPATLVLIFEILALPRTSGPLHSVAAQSWREHAMRWPFGQLD